MPETGNQEGATMRARGNSLRLIAGLVLAALLQGPGFAQGPPPPPPVTVATPLAKRIATWDEYSGRFEAVEAVEVRPRVQGFIEKVHFKDGQIVKAGDLLYTIDQRQFQIAFENAEAEIARFRAQVQLGESEVARAEPLVKSNAVTERDLEQRQATLNVARAQLQAAIANAKTAALNLDWTEVRAPISGRISDNKVDVGNLVISSTTSTTLLTTIVSLDPIHFVFDASEADYLRYSRLGISGARPSSREVPNPVRVKLADEEGWGHEGRMDFVDNQLNPRSGTIRARAIFDNKDQLLSPGVYARLRLFGGDVDALLIPDSSVVSDQMRKIVFTIGEDSTVKGVPVTLGPIVDGLRVVEKGLSVSDKVVIDGLANPMVRPGSKVTVEPGEIKAAATN
jgi:RND family efflux transporter MFP subunit